MRRAAIRRRRDIVAVFPAIFEAVPNTDPEGNHCKPSKISLLIRRTSLQPLQQKGAEKYGVRSSQPNSGKQNLSVIQKAAPQAPAPTSNSETVREAIMRELSTNPKWEEVKTSGKVSVIVGHRP